MKLLTRIIFSVVLLLGVGFAAVQAHAQMVPSGCTTNSGYSTSTGQPCNGVTTIPPGCTSTAGFSSSSGMPCNGAAAVSNGYTTPNTTVGANGFLIGCTSINGYSASTGYPCNMPIKGVIYTGNGTSVVVDPAAAGVVTTVPTTIPASPSLPTTGGGDSAPVTIAVLLASALVAFFGIRYSIKHVRTTA